MLQYRCSLFAEQKARTSLPPPVPLLPTSSRLRVQQQQKIKVIAALALGHFPLSTGAASTDRMFDLIQAITEDPIPALSPQAFSPELCDFVDLMLRRDPAERPTAPELLKHPFLIENHDQGCHIQSLVDMVKVAPATLPEVGCWARARERERELVLAFDRVFSRASCPFLACVCVCVLVSLWLGTDHARTGWLTKSRAHRSRCETDNCSGRPR